MGVIDTANARVFAFVSALRDDPTTMVAALQALTAEERGEMIRACERLALAAAVLPDEDGRPTWADGEPQEHQRKAET